MRKFLIIIAIIIIIVAISAFIDLLYSNEITATITTLAMFFGLYKGVAALIKIAIKESEKN